MTPCLLADIDICMLLAYKFTGQDEMLEILRDYVVNVHIAINYKHSRSIASNMAFPFYLINQFLFG